MGTKEVFAMLKYIDTARWVSAAFVWLIIGYAAISPAFAQSRPIPFVRQMTVCASLTDVYDVAMKDAKSKEGADFTQLLKEGKCAKVPAPLVNFYWYFDEYSDLCGEKGYISEVAYLGYYKHLYTIAASLPPLIDVTYKPEHEKNPLAVKQWFKEAHVKGPCDGSGKAWMTLGICGCCEFADRLHTKFVGEQGKEWSYYPDPNCTTKGCELLPIPDWVTHDEGIHALNGYDDNLTEFDQMRREGVLFIYKNQPSCFWPPEATDQ